MTRSRLDILLVERGLAESRAKAQALIMAGQVRVDGEVASRVAANISADASVTVDQGPRYVSRGGEKLEAALQAFSLDVSGWACADLGASTGGFTDCLFQHGAQKVYAIDVGKGILHWKLRTDPRIIVMEQTNARHVKTLPEPVHLVTIDASFISLKILLPVVLNWFRPVPADDGLEHRAVSAVSNQVAPGQVIALIKPQFEAGRKQAAQHKGIIRDPLVHRDVLFQVLDFSTSHGFKVLGLIRSPILGPKGNVEFLVHLEVGCEVGVNEGQDWLERVEQVLKTP